MELVFECMLIGVVGGIVRNLLQKLFEGGRYDIPLVV